jgi:transcription termination factor Rho
VYPRSGYPKCHTSHDPGQNEGRIPLSDTTDLKSGTSDADGADQQSAAAGAPRRRRSGTGLSAMLLSELQTLATSLGISGTGRMRKGELIAAIQARQAGGAPVTANDGRVPGPRQAENSIERSSGTPDRPAANQPAGDPEPVAVGAVREPAPSGNQQALPGTEGASAAPSRTRQRAGRPVGARAAQGGGEQAGESADRAERTGNDRPRNDRAANGGNERGAGDRGGNERAANDRGGNSGGGNGNRHDDEDGGSGRRRGRRYRDRRRGGGRDRGGEGGGGGEPAISEDDVLLPVAGIVDVLDNYAFIRTSGYLAGPNDVYVSMSQIRKYGLRRGDAVTGAVRAAREGEQRRDKYNPLVRLDTINGMDPEESKRRPDFYKLTPLYPQERLRLETEPNIITTRMIDLIMPIGKGQRALIMAPPKAGKTTVLQNIANGITTNNPEALLMVVLVDERPEEVTDMQRSVKGEVIAATFDRPPSDHTTLAELSIERAKRMVELGHDVVVMLDSITRLGRSYNLAAPASGRIMSGGLDSTALYPPKRFLGAARNIENGGSLTIIGTALVETGSVMDTVIFEEFKATGNAELKLDRKIADKRVFPAVDVNASSTRREEILLAPDELAIVHKLRRVLHALDPQQAIDLLLDRMKKTKTNAEFLMQIAKSTPGE